MALGFSITGVISALGAGIIPSGDAADFFEPVFLAAGFVDFFTAGLVAFFVTDFFADGFFFVVAILTSFSKSQGSDRRR